MLLLVQRGAGGPGLQRHARPRAGGPNWVELGNYTYTNGNSQFSYYWQCYYKGISFANQVIEKTAEIPDEMCIRDSLQPMPMLLFPQSLAAHNADAPSVA